MTYMKGATLILAGLSMISLSIGHTDSYHMTGHMWGGYWLGNILMILFTVLAVLGIIYLWQEVSENREQEGGNK